MNYKRQLSVLIAAAAFTLCCVSVQADNSQQDKMKSCNADATAKTLTGDDRKAFMKTCLSATPSSAATATPATATPATATPATASANSQQQKMKTCNADATAKTLTGDNRKAFMKTCLSATPSAAATATPAAGAAASATK